MAIPQDFYTSWGFGVDDENFNDGSFVGPNVNGAEGLINESSDLSVGLGSLSVTAQSSIIDLGDSLVSAGYLSSFGVGNTSELNDIFDGVSSSAGSDYGFIFEDGDTTSGIAYLSLPIDHDINESSDSVSGDTSLTLTSQSDIVSNNDKTSGVAYFTRDLTLNFGWGFSDDNENFFDGNFSHATILSASGTIDERSDTLDANGSAFVSATGNTTESSDLMLGSLVGSVDAQGNTTESNDLFTGTDTAPDGLNINSLAESFNEILYSQYSEPRDTPEIVAQSFTNAYVNYASRGVVLGANIQAGGNESLLLSAFSSDNTTVTITEMANGITNFWKSVNTPGPPAHGGTVVVSVELIMDAGALEAEIINNINVPTHSDGWLPMHTAIDSVLKSSVFVITELVAGVAVPFNETIS